jgi:hypothetical protein
MEHCFGNKDNLNVFPGIESLAKGVSFHWLENTSDLKIKNDADIKIDNNNESVFFIHYVIAMSGHYLDHCRGNYSDMINIDYIKILLEYFKFSDDEKNELTKLVIDTLNKTETEKGTNPEFNNINYKEMRTYLCKNLIIKRDDQDKFVKYSNNFEDCYQVLNLETEITDLLKLFDQKLPNPSPPPSPPPVSNVFTEVDNPFTSYSLNLPLNVKMFVKTIQKSEFPDFPKDTNGGIYQKLVYFEVLNGKDDQTYKIVPFWKIDSDATYRDDTLDTSDNKNKFYYLNQWFSNWYRSEIKIDNSDNSMFQEETKYQTVYTAEPLVFLKASLYSNSAPIIQKRRLKYINQVNQKWSIKDSDTQQHTSTGPITMVSDINDDVSSKTPDYDSIGDECKYSSPPKIHKSFAAYSENSKSLKNKCNDLYNESNIEPIIEYTIADGWKFERFPVTNEDISEENKDKNKKRFDVIYEVIEAKFKKTDINTDDTTKLYNILQHYPEDCLFVEASPYDNVYGVKKDCFEFLEELISNDHKINFIFINKNDNKYSNYLTRNRFNRTEKRVEKNLNMLGNAITKFRKEMSSTSTGGGGGFNQSTNTNTKPTKKEKTSKRNMNRVYKLREITNKKRNLKKKKKVQLSHKRRMTGKINHIKRCNRSYKKYSKKKGLKITKKKCNTK